MQTNTQTKAKGVEYKDVEAVMLDMLSNGVKPVNNNVRNITGGKTEKVAAFIRDFWDKRDAEIAKMSGDIVNSKVATLLANEIQLILDNKTAALTEIIQRQKSNITDMVDLLEEKQKDCEHEITLAQSQATKSINEANEKTTIANKEAEKAITEKQKAEAELTKVLSETAEKIRISKEKSEADKTKITHDSNLLIAAAEQRSKNEIQKTTVLIDAAKKEAESLVIAATERFNKSETETIALREQVKILTVDTAKRELVDAQNNKNIEIISELQVVLAETKTNIVILNTEKIGLEKDNKRLEKDSTELKVKSDQLTTSQTKLIDMQGQLSQTTQELSQANREIENLKLVLLDKD